MGKNTKTVKKNIFDIGVSIKLPVKEKPIDLKRSGKK